MKAYKVVNSNCWSSVFFYRTNLSLKYKKHKTTSPKVGKIFVFKNLKSAKKYIELLEANGHSGSRIFSGEAENCKRMLYMSDWTHSEEIQAYWEGFGVRKRTPYGTYGCDTFTPLEEIEI